MEVFLEVSLTLFIHSCQIRVLQFLHISFIVIPLLESDNSAALLGWVLVTAQYYILTLWMNI